ncbi:DUF6468 domain-containing protein [Sphingomonas sp. M6A6_1c]
MSFALITNLVLVVLCAVVALQATRMMRRIRDMRADNLHDTIVALDRATQEASQVLGEMKQLLATDVASGFRTIRTAQALQDELSVLIGIGNAVADRIIEASDSVRPEPETAEAAPDAEAEPTAAPAGLH